MLKKVGLPAMILTMICAVTTFILALTYVNTKEIIAQREIEDAQAIRKQVLTSAVTFDEKKTTVNGAEVAYYAGLDTSGNIIGYVFTTSAKGYGGDVSVMTGILPDGTIVGVVVLSNNETPGMGKKTENASFTDQFKAKLPDGSFKVVKKHSGKSDEIDAVSGATISSTAVTKAVNAAVEIYRSIGGIK